MSRPCPDCGEPISLIPSGWWTHDGPIYCPVRGWKFSDDPFNEMEDEEP